MDGGETDEGGFKWAAFIISLQVDLFNVQGGSWW